MAGNIETNLIVKTKLDKPTGTGIDDTLTKLEGIAAAIAKINKSEVIINLKTRGLKQVEAILNRVSAINVGASGAGGAGPIPNLPKGPMGIPGVRGRREQVILRENAAGIRSNEAIAKNIKGDILTVNKIKATESEEGDKISTTENITNMRDRTINNAKKKAEQDRINRELGITKSDEQRIRGSEEKKRRDNAIKQKISDEEFTRTGMRSGDARGQQGPGVPNEIRIANTAARKAEDDRIKEGMGLQPGVNPRGQQGPFVPNEIRIANAAARKAEDDRIKEGMGLQPGVNPKGKQGQFVPEDILANRSREKKQVIDAERQLAKEVRATANANVAAAQTQKLLDEGFKEHQKTTTQSIVNGKKLNTTLTEFRRITGSPLLGNLAIDVAKVNSATGDMIKVTKQGADALQLFKERFTGALTKVGNWIMATATIYALGVGVRNAAQQFKELEANTIFMARVGENITGKKEEGPDAFNKRLSAAKELTKELIGQTQLLGGSGVEAQQASSIFLRGQQNKKQALESTTVAILASQIAELSLVESAELLSSAQSQFNLSSSQLLPTLDAVNELSNKYRVTTDDLLQSISRSGSVYASTNGSLEALAATTAIVAQRTRRSGAEIGNALKTIISRLSSPETASAIIERAGVSAADNQGNLKEFTTVLLELNLALQRVSEEEKSRIGVQIAGARQVNILKNAMDGVIDIIIAEYEALKSQGSAMLEAANKSATLESALARLQGTFSAIINTGDAFGGTITVFVNSLNFLLKMATGFDSLLIKMALVVVAFLAVRGIVMKLTPAFLQLGAAVGITSLSFGAATKSLAAWNLQTTLAAASTKTLGAIFSRLNWIVLGVTVVLAGVTLGLNAYEEAQVRDSILQQRAIELANNKATALERQAQAQEVLSSKLNILAQMQRKYNKEAAEGKNVNDKQNVGDIIRVSAAGGVKLTEEQVRNTKELDKATETYHQRVVKAYQEEARERRAATVGNEKQIKNNETKIKQLEEQLALEAKTLEKFPDDPDAEGAGYQARLDIVNKINESEKQINDTLESNQNLNRDILENNKAIEDAIANSRKEQEKLNEGLKDIDKRFKLIVDSVNAIRKISNVTQSLPGANPGQEISREIQLVTEELNNLNKEIEVAKQARNYSGITKMIEKGNEFRVVLEQLNVSLLKIKLDSFIKAFGEIDNLKSFAQQTSFGQQQRLKIASDKNTPEEFKKMQLKDVESLVVKKDLQRVLLEINGIVAEQLTGEEKLAKTVALKTQAQELMIKARDLELEKITTLLDMEVEITKQKVQQRKEIAAAIGLLSTEDKIGLLDEMNRQAKNPNKKISFEEQFFASADTNRLNQQFMPSRLDEGFNPEKQFDKMFIDAGVGISRETSEVERLIKERMAAAGGVPGLIGQGVTAAEDLDKQRRKLAGEFEPGSSRMSDEDFKKRLPPSPFWPKEEKPEQKAAPDNGLKDFVNRKKEQLSERDKSKRNLLEARDQLAALNPDDGKPVLMIPKEDPDRGIPSRDMPKSPFWPKETPDEMLDRMDKELIEIKGGPIWPKEETPDEMLARMGKKQPVQERNFPSLRETYQPNEKDEEVIRNFERTKIPEFEENQKRKIERQVNTDVPGGSFMPSNLNVDIKTDTFAPLVDAFRDAAQIQMNKLRDDMIKEIRDIWREVNVDAGVPTVANEG